MPTRSELAEALAYFRPSPSTHGPVILTPAKMRERLAVIEAALRDSAGAAMQESAPLTEPSPGLLMSMAIRSDHGLAVPGYYDQPLFAGQPSHARRLECALGEMRKLWEEVTGNGFYRPDREDRYVAMRERVLADTALPFAEGADARRVETERLDAKREDPVGREADPPDTRTLSGAERDASADAPADAQRREREGRTP